MSNNSYGIVIATNDFENDLDPINAVLKTVKDGIYDFVQLIVFPDSYEPLHTIIAEKFKGIKTVIHAPFYMHGVDIANPDLLQSNISKLKSSQKFADLLHSEIIVIHPGVGDGEQYLNETIRQLKILNDSRAAIENLPYHPRADLKMHGSTPENILKIINETKCKFCFDFAHAICAANSLNLDIHETFQKFAKLKPDIYHLSDGEISATIDLHMHLGQGNYNLQMIFQEFLPKNATITLETRRKQQSDINLCIKDAQIARKLEQNILDI